MCDEACGVTMIYDKFQSCWGGQAWFYYNKEDPYAPSTHGALLLLNVPYINNMKNIA